MTARRLTAIFAALATAACGSLVACSSTSTSGDAPANSATKGPKITVAMVTHGESFDPFWSLVKKGAEQAAADFNVTLKYQSPKTTNPQAQASLITNAAAKKPDAMVVTIPDASVLTSPVKQAASTGLPVIIMNVGDNLTKEVGALTFVGQPEITAGEEAGKQMTAAGVHHALCVIHEERNTALTDRCAGFSKELAASGGSVKVLHVNGSQLSQAADAIESALKADKSIDGVLATGIIGFNAAGGALQSMNAFGKIKLGTFDISASDLRALQNGQAQFVIDQQPFLEGYDAVQVAAFQVRFGQHPYSSIYTGPSLVTKANAAKVASLYKSTGVPLFKGGYPQ